MEVDELTIQSNIEFYKKFGITQEEFIKNTEQQLLDTLVRGNKKGVNYVKNKG